MRLSIETTLEYFMPEPADVLLIVEAANLADQQLIEDRLVVNGSSALRPIDGEDGTGRRTWTQGYGDFSVSYRAKVEVDRRPRMIDELPIMPRSSLPSEVIPYLWPSRYCEGDRFESFIEHHSS